MPGDAPDPRRPIRLDQATRVNVSPRNLSRLHEKAPTYNDIEPRIGDGSFTPTEQRTVDWLERRGITVEKVAEDNVLKSPDAAIRAERATVELKVMRSSTKRSIRRQVRRAAEQSRHLVIDARGTGLTEPEAREWLISTIYSDGHYLDQVVVVLDGPGVAPLEWSRVR